MSRRAFTLIELVAIMIVVGLLSAVVFINLGSHQAVKLDAAAQKVAADIKYAKSLALSTAQWYGVEFGTGEVVTRWQLGSPAYAFGWPPTTAAPTTTTTTIMVTTTTLLAPSTTLTPTTTTVIVPTTPPPVTTTQAVVASSVGSLGENQYQVYLTDGTSDTLIDNPAKAGFDFVVNLSELFPGVVISSVIVPGGEDKIEFDPLGAPHDDKNGSALTAEAVVTLTYQGTSKSIKVTAITGRVYVE